MAKRGGKSGSVARRVYPQEFKEEAVQMLLDGHSASSVCERLGLSGTNLLYRWKKGFLGKEGSDCVKPGCARSGVGSGTAVSGTRT